MSEEEKLTSKEVVKALEKSYIRGKFNGEAIFNAIKLIYSLEENNYRKKAEIEQLTTENKRLTEENRVIEHNLDFHRNQKFELQKQVDELKEELEKAYITERVNIQAEIAEAGTSCQWCQNVTIRDTTKKIFEELLKEENLEPFLFTYNGNIRDGKMIREEKIKEIAKRNGMEVK